MGNGEREREREEEEEKREGMIGRRGIREKGGWRSRERNRGRGREVLRGEEEAASSRRDEARQVMVDVEIEPEGPYEVVR